MYELEFDETKTTYTSIGVGMNGPGEDLIVCIRMSHTPQADITAAIKEELVVADIQNLPTYEDKIHLFSVVIAAINDYVKSMYESEVTK